MGCAIQRKRGRAREVGPLRGKEKEKGKRRRRGMGPLSVKEEGKERMERFMLPDPNPNSNWVNSQFFQLIQIKGCDVFKIRARLKISGLNIYREKRVSN